MLSGTVGLRRRFSASIQAHAHGDLRDRFSFFFPFLSQLHPCPSVHVFSSISMTPTGMQLLCLLI